MNDTMKRCLKHFTSGILDFPTDNVMRDCEYLTMLLPLAAYPYWMSTTTGFSSHSLSSVSSSGVNSFLYSFR